MMTEEPVRHILSLSGGKDSTALAIYLRDRVPNMEYIFHDTGKELPDTLDYIERLEAYLGTRVVRTTIREDFDNVLRSKGGMLPSGKRRWCTELLKLKPFENYIGDEPCINYVGIRADEDRVGYVSHKPNIKAVFPFREDGIDYDGVVRILEDAGLGMPPYTEWGRTRSGCYFCFYQQKIEWVRLDVETPAGVKRLHFIFEFSGWCPEKGQPWPAEKLDLLERFVRSVREPHPSEYFIIAANDGRLVQAWDSLPENAAAKSLAPSIEELLANDRCDLEGHDLLFLNLSRMPTAEILQRALDCLLNRDEWRCLEDEIDDPAFSPQSPLSRNFQLLKEPSIRTRLIELADLMDSNGFHVPIREIMILLVNGLLGWRGAANHVCTVDDLRRVTVSGPVHEAALYSNLFGANLIESRREGLSVFRLLGGFRIGHETTNLLDSLLIFGADDENLQADHAAYLANDPYYGDNPAFEALRRSYLEAEDERTDGAQDFLQALVNERRRLFFRLPGDNDRLEPWKLSVFPSAGAFRRQVLEPLRAGRPVEAIVLQRLVCGLNRIWTGMLAGDLDRLYLSTGLDLSSAKVSDIYLYEVPLRPTPHGDQVSVISKDDFQCFGSASAATATARTSSCNSPDTSS